jgi:DNA-binding MarR family transcriptional regulator
VEIKKDEINILEEMEKEPIISQRELSERTGLSLGMVNILVKKCIKTGLVKVENLNARTVKYILTPKGINEKAKKTLRYIRSSYRFLLEISDKIEKIVKEDVENKKDIYLYGDKDEIMEIIIEVLHKANKKFEIIDKVEEIKNKNNSVIYVWDTDTEIEEKDIEVVNIFKSR